MFVAEKVLLLLVISLTDCPNDDKSSFGQRFLVTMQWWAKNDLDADYHEQ